MPDSPAPTPYTDVNEALSGLLAQLRETLGADLVGMYLTGSLAQGGFDPRSSDIDYVVVTIGKLSDEHFSSLQRVHAGFDAGKSPWAGRVEAVYIPRVDIRSYGGNADPYPQKEKGGELFLGRHDIGGVFQAYILREHGVTLTGPAPRTLIEPVDPAALRQAAGAIALMWRNDMRDDPTWLDWLRSRPHQAFVVLTLCRLLFTLETGGVASKPEAASWARQALGDRWSRLVERALARQQEDTEIGASEESETLALLKYTVEKFMAYDG